MLPIILRGRAALAGAGDALERRRKFLIESGVESVVVEPQSPGGQLTGFSTFFVAGLSRSESERLVAAAREARVLVNVEDEPDLCDFYVPAIVRRGDLLIAISTSGKAPGLASLLRQWIERTIPPAWAIRLAEVSARRVVWRANGSSPVEVARKTAAFADEQGWFA